MLHSFAASAAQPLAEAARQREASRLNPRERMEHQLLDMLGPRLRGYRPPDEHEHPAIWVGQMFGRVKAAVAAGDTQAISLACELIERDPMLPFGKLIKSNLARALKKQLASITASERGQVLCATAKLLNQEYAPRELEDYCKLIRKFPRAEVALARAGVTPKNAKSVQLLDYLHDNA